MYFLGHAPWDLSSQPKDQTCAPALGAGILSPWATRQVPHLKLSLKLASLQSYEGHRFTVVSSVSIEVQLLKGGQNPFCRDACQLDS